MELTAFLSKYIEETTGNKVDKITEISIRQYDVAIRYKMPPLHPYCNMEEHGKIINLLELIAYVCKD